MAELDRQGENHRGAELRTEARLPYHSSAGVIATLHHPGGSVVNYLVRPRNLSRRGVGFLHGNFVHIGSRCQVHLLRLDRRPEAINGAVARCQHVDGLVHEIGVRFDEPIELAHFLTRPGDALPVENQGESVELPKLAGTVLSVDNSVDGQELLRFHLSNLGVEMTVAADALEATEALQRHRFDLIITEIWLPGMTGPQLVGMLRADGYTGPIVALTSDDSGKTREEALKSGYTDVFSKPYTLEQLIKWLTPHLGGAKKEPDRAECLRSTEWGKPQMRPLILGFLGRMEEQVQRLTELAASEADRPLIQSVSRELKGSAGGYGYPLVSRVAAELCTLAADDTAWDMLRTKCHELAELCRKACVIRQEADAAR